MGSCVSKADCSGKEGSILPREEDRKYLKRECKILLLGAGESGKTTIAKQMKIIHQDGFSQRELQLYRPVVYGNVLDSAHCVLKYMRKIGLECMQASNRALVKEVLDFRLDTTSANFPTRIAQAIHRLWKDPAVIYTMDGHFSNLYIMDSAAYFFDEVIRIGAPEYLPTEMDVLRIKKKSVGVTETRFAMGQLSIHLFDMGGTRSERKKWIHCFESVTSIIFCTALSEYNQALLEDETTNRMLESLVLFESVINSRWCQQTSIILFLNKIDIFKKKLPKVPLERYFPEYLGGPDINKAVKFILWKFMQANRARLSVYPHLTQAVDTTHIQLVFVSVKATILHNFLKNSGIL
ncbi:hypothetical protein GALMADRAFT_232380 [Galerina marginata CBS 339.88]|uniref:Uncharacterized protein n=1 Tax=Galerina marginata (strain CBS 339.88) TaxID=685588 RepID=A0A067SIQ2_GALM3|nr:hypothetical protein GALMADRAFT_232380 [Galerina marginata CBS 339.88]